MGTFTTMLDNNDNISPDPLTWGDCFSFLSSWQIETAHSSICSQSREKRFPDGNTTDTF